MNSQRRRYLERVGFRRLSMVPRSQRASRLSKPSRSNLRITNPLPLNVQLALSYVTLRLFQSARVASPRLKLHVLSNHVLHGWQGLTREALAAFPALRSQ